LEQPPAHRVADLLERDRCCNGRRGCFRDHPSKSECTRRRRIAAAPWAPSMRIARTRPLAFRDPTEGGVMFRQVIVGVDGRPAGRDAIALARVLVAPEGRLTLVHVHHGELESTGAADEDSRRLLARERDAAAIEGELAPLAAPSVGRGLHHAAEALPADLLVVGSCSRGFVGRVLVGNDTRAALNGAPCAVAVAPLGYATDLRAIATVGVGYDGSPESKNALALAREVAGRHGAVLKALDVVQIPASSWSSFAGAAWGTALEEFVDGARRDVDSLDGVDGDVVLGIAGEELAAFGERVDLLVVGSRGYGPVRRLMLGSTSEYLAGHARSPLLVLPRTAAQAPDTPAADGERVTGVTPPPA
jgi:nucleotide-binding universal stress UspA family protein